MKRGKARLAASALAVAVVVIVAAAAALASTTRDERNAVPARTSGSTAQVKIGLTPFFDYMLWPFAANKGLDKELDIDLEFTWLAQVGPSVQAMRRGSIDVIDTCTACNFSFYKSVPTIRDWLLTNQFKGFILIGRKGAPSYNQLVKSGMSPTAAKKKVFNFVKGKTFAIHKPVYGALVNGMLENAGLSSSDVKIIDFADDVKAATAYLRGSGDFYLGGLPQETKLLLSYGDRFVNMGGAEILGPAGLWYSTAASDEKWLKENRDTALKLIAIWYRASRYLNERPNDVIPVFRKEVNAHAAASFTDKQVKFTVTEFLDFMSIQEAKQKAFNPKSDLYWRKSLNYYSAQHKKAGDLDKSLNVNPFNQEEQFFKELLRNKQLMTWINKPL